MPHLIIDCCENILSQVAPQEILQKVYQAAEATNLFAKSGTGGIKVRIRPYQHYITVNSQDDFIHIFAYIREGRNDEQKRDLSLKVVAALTTLFPDVPIISINIQEFDDVSYVNKSMI